MYNIFDTHAHYDDEQYDEDRDLVLAGVKENGVGTIVNVGCTIERSAISVDLANQYSYIYAAVGIHPHSALSESKKYPDYINLLREYAKGDKVVAIGEIGLDYHYDLSPRDTQKEVFIAQLELAKSIDKPVIIHSREATKDVIDILDRHSPKGVVHCFSGSKETAEHHVKKGLYIGYTGIVTFNNAKRVLEAVAATPLDRILLETDCPYMAPVPFRGKRCTSDMIVNSARVIAEIKDVSTNEMIDIARNNGNRLLGIG